MGRQIVKYCSIMLLLMATNITRAEAQTLCLGERIPDVYLLSTIGTDVQSITSDYVCLVFAHSESEPSIEAIDIFADVAAIFSNELSVVLITPEVREAEHDELDIYVNNQISVAFDDGFRTFDGFGVKYIPFGVIYERRSRNIVWFGSIGQLDTAALVEIVKINTL